VVIAGSNRFNTNILTFSLAVYVCLTQLSKYNMIICPKSMNQPVFTFGIFSVYFVRNEIRRTFICQNVVSSRVMTLTNVRANPRVISSGLSDPETGFCPSNSGFPVSITLRVPVSGQAEEVWKPSIKHCCLEHWRELERKLLCVVFRCFKD